VQISQIQNLFFQSCRFLVALSLFIPIIPNLASNYRHD